MTNVCIYIYISCFSIHFILFALLRFMFMFSFLFYMFSFSLLRFIPFVQFEFSSCVHLIRLFVLYYCIGFVVTFLSLSFSIRTCTRKCVFWKVYRYCKCTVTNCDSGRNLGSATWDRWCEKCLVVGLSDRESAILGPSRCHWVIRAAHECEAAVEVQAEKVVAGVAVAHDVDAGAVPPARTLVSYSDSHTNRRNKVSSVFFFV